MAKKKSKPTDSDDLLIEGLQIIGEGIENGDTNRVAEGYSLIVGHKVAWPEPKSRLDKVRGALNKKKTDAPSRIILPDSDEAKDLGDTEKIIHDMYSGENFEEPKVNPIDAIGGLGTAIEGEVINKGTDKEEKIILQPGVTLQKGGKKFGASGPIVVISDGYIPEEASRNQAMAQKVRKTKVVRNTALKPIGDEDSDFSFNPNPRRRSR